MIRPRVFGGYGGYLDICSKKKQDARLSRVR